MLRRFAVMSGCALVALIITASPAFAHAVLDDTYPVQGAAYTKAPQFVSLHFDESVGVKEGGVRVYNAAGSLLNAGKPTHPNSDGSRVELKLPHLSSGSYVVTWRVISADTHPVDGAFTFQVGNKKENVNALTTRLLSSNQGSKTVGVLYGIARFGIFASVLVFLGGLIFLVFIWPAGQSFRRSSRVMWSAWFVAFIATIFGFLIEGPYATAFPLRDVVRSSVWNETLHSRYGELALLRALLLLSAFVLLRCLFSSRKTQPSGDKKISSWAKVSAIIFSIGIILTISFSGHATTGRWVIVAFLTDVLHVAGSSAWLGGLLLVALVLLPLADIQTLKTIIPRYSQYALIAISVIVASGTLQSIRQVGSISALTSTTYGRLLLAKIGVVILLIGIAAISRKFVNQLCQVRDSQDSGDVLLRRNLKRSVAIEVVIAIAILSLTAFLVDARPAYTASIGPVQTTVKTSKLWFDLIVEPAKAGPNAIHLTAVTPAGGLADPLQMSMQVTNQAHDVGPLNVPLLRAGPGHMLASGFVFPFPGSWKITITALVDQINEVSASVVIAVR